MRLNHFRVICCKLLVVRQQYGLIGYPLGHSFSQRYFTEKFAREGILDARYDLFPLPDIAQLPALLRAHPALRGLNVTIPHKQTVIPFLTRLDETAAAVGAVNCIRIGKGGLEGFNTDVYGFEQSLLGFLQKNKTAPQGLPAYILGTGGAAKAAAFVLKKLGIGFQYVSRNPRRSGDISYGALAQHIAPAALFVNTTPLGMSPDTERCPDLPFERLGPGHLVFDLIYNPAETLLMCRAAQQGAAVQNGLEMLVLQAEKAWEVWQSDGD